MLLVRNHHEVLPFWNKRRDMTVLHFDAHLDYHWDKTDPVSLANFVRTSMEHGSVREFIWITPDEYFASSSVVRRLESFLKTRLFHPSKRAEIKRTNIGLHAVVGGIPVVCLPFSNLSKLRLQTPLLVDVDLDFFFITNFRHPFPDSFGPSIWLDDFFPALTSLPDPDVVTISESIDGCYTDVQWRPLGQILLDAFSGHAWRDAATALLQSYRGKKGYELLRTLKSSKRILDLHHPNCLRLQRCFVRGRLQSSLRIAKMRLAISPEDDFARLVSDWVLFRTRGIKPTGRAAEKSTGFEGRQLLNALCLLSDSGEQGLAELKRLLLKRIKNPYAWTLNPDYTFDWEQVDVLAAYTLGAYAKLRKPRPKALVGLINGRSGVPSSRLMWIANGERWSVQYAKDKLDSWIKRCKRGLLTR